MPDVLWVDAFTCLRFWEFQRFDVQTERVCVFSGHPCHIAVNNNGKTAPQRLGQGDKVISPHSNRISGGHQPRCTVAAEGDDSPLQGAV